MTKDNLVTAPEGTTLDEAMQILKNIRLKNCLLFDDDFNLKGLITIKILKKP